MIYIKLLPCLEPPRTGGLKSHPRSAKLSGPSTGPAHGLVRTMSKSAFADKRSETFKGSELAPLQGLPYTGSGHGICPRKGQFRSSWLQQCFHILERPLPRSVLTLTLDRFLPGSVKLFT